VSVYIIFYVIIFVREKRFRKSYESKISFIKNRGGQKEKKKDVNEGNKKSKGIPRQAEVALGVPGRLRPRIFSTLGTTRVVGRQSNAPAALTPGEIPGTHFQRLSQP